MVALRDYDCDSCKPSRQIRYGCEGEGTAIEAQFVIGKQQFFRCPKAMMKEMPLEDRVFLNKILTYYAHWERGILPQAGGVDDQDQFIMSMLPTISGYVKQYQNEGKA